MTDLSAQMLARRERRKQDLLLASGLARQQAILSIDDIGRRADVVVLGYRRVRSWLSAPKPGTIAAAAASLTALLSLRRVRFFRLLHWGLLGWRIARLGALLLPARRLAR